MVDIAVSLLRLDAGVVLMLDGRLAGTHLKRWMAYGYLLCSFISGMLALSSAARHYFGSEATNSHKITQEQQCLYHA